MKYRQLGRSGLRVSELALGSWLTDVSDTTKQELAAQSVQLAYENGINYFDCADVYSGGGAERFLGNALQQFSRKELVISSKVYFPSGKGVNDRGLSRKHITESIDQSLINLQVDYLDLYFCHRFDTQTPLAETLTTLSGLVDQGKILYYGVSEWTPVQILKAELIIQERGLHPITVVQPEYNMFDRYIEHELIDLCGEMGLGIVPFSPLAQGLLTGKYRQGQPAPAGSRGTFQPDLQAQLVPENFAKIAELTKMAAELDTDLATFALAWDKRDPRISSLIVGASKPAQLKNNLKAVDLKIPTAYEERINKLFGFKKFFREI
ncbi:aldo/keto reductase family protein [Levilactobacillus fujinensis]|uniref:Aldo/keto reductase family protein n=1 Tax=Levilactobacillus fujinensis TaxID=2486024 RepID=A0ABW1TFT4_9LACO|nr:aldo/keto reductase family protein [Levilactobacillus fujinensis]